MRVGGGGGMRAFDATVTVDPVVVNGQTTTEGGALITGEKPPLVPKSWWPWILGIAAIGVGWWIVKDDVEEEGAGEPRPFEG